MLHALREISNKRLLNLHWFVSATKLLNNHQPTNGTEMSSINYRGINEICYLNSILLQNKQHTMTKKHKQRILLHINISIVND